VNTASFVGRSSFAAKEGKGEAGKKKPGSSNAVPNPAGANPIADAMAQALQESAAKTSAFDPYAAVDEAARRKKEAERVEAPGVLDPDRDFPEGFVVDPEVTEQLSQLRIQKINSENQLAVKSRELKAMQDQLFALEAQEKAVETQIADLEAEKAGLEDRIERYDVNLEVLVAVKQGQDEIVQDPVTTDYSDAMLVDRSVVEVTNEAIVKLGKEKVAILTKIKNFRKNINFMLWEHKFLEETANNLDEHYTDLHMLRVTKSLQSFIKGGDTANKQKIEIEKAEAKLEHMKVQHADKMHKLEKKMNKISHQTDDRASENDRLSEQIAQLRGNVEMRESIHRSRFESGDGGEEDPAQQAAQRMRTITMRRKLIDLARAQTDEIEFLRQELDRLRQRTFPSFAHSNNRVNRAGNMDEIGIY
jgi:chromosome segregation ATPase